VSDSPFTELHELAVTVARSVGEEVTHRRTADFAWSAKSSATDVVTEIDEWAEEEVVRLLSAERNLRVGAVHGDLNLENVLVDPEARTVHLIDFALSRGN